MNKEKMSVLDFAIVSEEKNDKQRYFLNTDKLSEEYQESLRAIAFEIHDDTSDFDLTYEILNDACMFVSELEEEEIKDDNWRDSATLEFASVYTQARLEYLNQNNEYNITEIMRECECDIQDACAQWYDERVNEAIDMVINWLKA